MAKADVTTSVTRGTRAPKGETQAPAFIQATNPLSCERIVDTIQTVNSVLSLLQNYVLCDAEQNVIDFDSSGGIYHILQCCKAALDAHVAQEGGAA